jgi:hypothetical protein
MSNRKIIVLCGRAQSGKSTAAKLIKDHLGTYQMAFADPMKKMMKAMGEGLGLEDRHLYGTNADKNEPLEVFMGNTTRYALQTLGTEWRNLLSPQLWTNHLLMRLNHVNPSVMIVIDDMRFAHEYYAMKDLGATIIGIERPGQGASNSTHASETWDFKSTGMPVIQNDGTVEQLWEKLKTYL